MKKAIQFIIGLFVLITVGVVVSKVFLGNDIDLLEDEPTHV